jgi:hypothetical protein
MSHHRDHHHTTNVRSTFHEGKSPESFAAVAGTVEKNSERPITGHSGDHLQFYVDVGGGAKYQVDVNTRSKDGSDIEVYIADEGNNPNDPFSAQDPGVFTDAQVSYKAMGLTDSDFAPITYFRMDGQLSAALNAAEFVVVYGMTFDDGGPNGKGVHEVHYNGGSNHDGAVLVYSTDAGTSQPKRTWFFFKFNDENIG